MVEKQIIVSSFGETRSTIRGNDTCALIVDSCQFISFSNLNFVGSGRKAGNKTSGLVVRKSNNITVDSVDVSGFQKYGVDIIDAENIRITHVHAFENGTAGIRTGTVYQNPIRLLSKNIYIGYCTTENNPGNPTILNNHSGSGIIISGTDGAVVEYCLAKNNGWDQPWDGNGPIGIWAFHANDVIIQNCIAHSNKSHPEGWDGGGFDLDGGVTNSIMQYNYSYNNVGPGYGLYQYWSASPWNNNIMRYNISINDGIENDSCGIHIWSGEGKNKSTMKNAQIYNNLIISEFGRAVDYKFGNVPELFFWNNIFVSKQRPIYGEHSKSVFYNNLYWSFGKERNISEDKNGIIADPKIKLPKPIAFPLEDPTKLKELNYYTLLSGSPALGSGLPIENNGEIDFWDNKIPNDPDSVNIGVWQK
jgi:hypothetical protein